MNCYWVNVMLKSYNVLKLDDVISLVSLDFHFFSDLLRLVNLSWTRNRAIHFYSTQFVFELETSERVLTVSRKDLTLAML